MGGPMIIKLLEVNLAEGNVKGVNNHCSGVEGSICQQNVFQTKNRCSMFIHLVYDEDKIISFLYIFNLLICCIKREALIT